jgi:hypothetical protein
VAGRGELQLRRDAPHSSAVTQAEGKSRCVPRGRRKNGGHNARGGASCSNVVMHAAASFSEEWPRRALLSRCESDAFSDRVGT